MVLSQGCVFDQIFLSQGCPVEKRSLTPLSKFFQSTPPPPPPQGCRHTPNVSLYIYTTHLARTAAANIVRGPHIAMTVLGIHTDNSKLQISWKQTEHWKTGEIIHVAHVVLETEIQHITVYMKIKIHIYVFVRFRSRFRSDIWCA